MRLVATCQRVNDDAIFTLDVRLEVQRKKRVIQTFLSEHATSALLVANATLKPGAGGSNVMNGICKHGHIWLLQWVPAATVRAGGMSEQSPLARTRRT
ncbi:hypothetical protein WQE_15809 [Paraburkholderia hospita]|uniref:Uncharacterized protein n=1 Tax=Paraburkholderia hospita TaxID=169430 RepID=A0ABN0FMP6_9BURK|nr:hypothetical protein WQE_15809 [Paraburkholderia hospita]